MNNQQSACFFIAIFSSVTFSFANADQKNLTSAVERNMEIISEWPAEANGDLPLAGIFFGNAQSGTATTNSSISVESSRRFRAQKSGNVVSFRFHNRVLSNRDINKKCKRLGTDSAWCACIRANLDAYTCGYTIGSSYSVGNGGRIVVQIVLDNGHGFPNKTVVLSSSEAFVPMELSQSSSSHYVTIRFLKSANLVAGKIYHLLFKNLNPPVGCALSNVPVSQAVDCPKTQGAISINGIYDGNSPSVVGRWGPMLGTKGSATLHRDINSNEWTVYGKGAAFYELHYSDGTAVGESYHALDALTDGQNEIQGDSVARQRFIVQHTDYNVTGVWINHGVSQASDGSDATVSLVDEYRNVLVSGKLKASDVCLKTRIQKCRDWGYVDFKRAVQIQENAEYSLEIKGGEKSGYLLSAYRSLEAHGFEDRNHWDDARAELSTNDGETWSIWTRSGVGKYRDLPVLFTLAGMPVALP